MHFLIVMQNIAKVPQIKCLSAGNAHLEMLRFIGWLYLRHSL
jgi:hypothetical protein